MELNAIIAFLFIFILVVSVLVGIAYFGIKETKYEDLETKKSQQQQQSDESGKSYKKQKSNGLVGGSKKEKVKSEQQQQQQQQQAKKQQQQTQKKRKNSSSNNQSSDEIQEEPILIIPDPFSGVLTSRFAGATSNSKKANNENQHHQQHHYNNTTENRKVAISSEKSNSQQSSSGGQVAVANNKNQETLNQQINAEKAKVKVMVVKPSLNTAVVANNHQEDTNKQPKLIKVNLVNSRPLTNTQLNGDVGGSGAGNSSNYEIQINDLTHKLKEVSSSLNDKSKRVDDLSRENLEIKASLGQYQSSCKKLTNDFETLKPIRSFRKS
jgi:hypothetical protein